METNRNESYLFFVFQLFCLHSRHCFLPMLSTFSLTFYIIHLTVLLYLFAWCAVSTHSLLLTYSLSFSEYTFSSVCISSFRIWSLRFKVFVIFRNLFSDDWIYLQSHTVSFHYFIKLGILLQNVLSVVPHIIIWT